MLSLDISLRCYGSAVKTWLGQAVLLVPVVPGRVRVVARLPL